MAIHTSWKSSAIRPDEDGRRAVEAEYTSDLLDLLNVLGRLVALEPAQADLLVRICDGPLVEIEGAGQAA